MRSRKSPNEAYDGVDDIMRTTAHLTIPLWLLDALPKDEAVVLAGIINAAVWAPPNLVDEDWFMCTSEFLGDKLSMSRREQERIMANLEERGLIERKMMRNPAKRWLRLNRAAFEEMYHNS